MIYLTQYTTRKGEQKNKKFEAPNMGAVRDRIRREGAKNIVIFPDGQGYVCPKCGKLVEGYAPDEPCRNCKYS